MYALEHSDEAKRLEDQNSKELYSIKNELAHIIFKNNEKILDAGCGTGAISRYIKSVNESLDCYAVDVSDIRIEQAKNIASEEGRQIHFQTANLEALPFEDNSFDKIVCRFVFHHLNNPNEIVDEFYRVLKPGGQLVIIDSDGIMFNFYCHDQKLIKLMNTLKKKLPMDLFAARKLKVFMGQKFTSKQSHIIPMHFQGTNLKDEIYQYKERFRLLESVLKEALESESDEFVTRYLDALSHPDTELFYNKFTVAGIKR